MSGQTVFGDLEIGDEFTLPNNPFTYRKTKPCSCGIGLRERVNACCVGGGSSTFVFVGDGEEVVLCQP